MKRVLVRIVVLMLLGAVTTVAITFASAKWVEPEPDPALLLEPTHSGWLSSRAPTSQVVVFRALGAMRLYADRYGGKQQELIDDDLRENPALLKPQLVPRWVKLASDGSPPGVVEARGWPFLAFWCEFTDEGGWSFDEYGIAGGLDIRFPRPPRRTSGGLFGAMVLPPAIPLRPIWNGLIGDIFVFAVLWWSLVFSTKRLWQWSRLRRGLCPNCAYDLHGAVHDRCPECGALTARQPRASPPAKLGA